MIWFLKLGMADKPIDEIDQMAALERCAELGAFEAPAQNLTNYFISIFHFEATLERTLIGEPITKYVGGCVSHSVSMGGGIKDFRQIHDEHSL